MVSSATVIPVVNLGGFGFLFTPSPPTVGAPKQNYASESVLVANVVPVMSGSPNPLNCAGCPLSKRFGLLMSNAFDALSNLWSGIVASGTSALSTATHLSSWLWGRMLALYGGLTAPIPALSGSPLSALTSSQTSPRGNPIPPNSTAGYVENTLVLSNDTLLPGDVPNPFDGAVPPATPESVATSPSNGMIYVAGVTGSSNTTVFEISPTTDKVVRSTTLVPSADTQCGSYGPALTLDPTTGYLYVTSSGCPTPVVVVFDTNNNTVLKSIALPSNFGAVAVAYDASSNEVYVTGNSFSTENVVIINATSNSIATSIDSLGGCWTFAPVYDANDGLMYVTTWFCGATFVVGHADMFGINSTNSVVATIPIPAENTGISSLGAGTATITPGGTIYLEENSAYTPGSDGVISYPIDVVDPQANTSSVIEVSCGYRYVSSTCGPVGLAFDPANGYLYSTASVGSYPQNVSAIDPSTGKAVGFMLTGGQALLGFAYSSGGPREIAFDQSNNQLYDVSGGSGTVSVIYDTRFNITLTESGLPSGDEWGTVIAGTAPKYATSNSITYSAPNGVYQLNVTAKDGYCASLPSRMLAVNGSDVSQTIQFTSSGCYTVTFTESGLPDGELWGANLSGFESSAISPFSVSFTEANGNYTYVVSSVGRSDYLGVIGYGVSPYSGTATLNGSDISIPLQYSIFGRAGILNVYVHTNSAFYSGTETVLVNGNVTASPSVNFTTYAMVTLTNPLGAVIRSDTVAVNATTGLFSDNFTTGGPGWIGGTYTVTVLWPTGPGCTTSPESCSFAQPTSQFGYLPPGPTYQVAFVEAGLPQGTTWTVTFANVTKTSTSSTIDYSFPDGYYPYTLPDVGPYVPQVPPRTQMVLVNGSGVTEDVGFVYSEQLLLYNGTTYPGSALTAFGAYNTQIRQLTYDPVNGMLYALSSTSPNRILGVNATTKSIIQEFNVVGVDTVTVDPSSGYLLVTNSSVLSNADSNGVLDYYLGATVTIINPIDGAIVAVAPLLPHPSAAEYITGVQSAGFASSTGTFYALVQITNSSETYTNEVVYAVSGTTGAVESNFTVSTDAFRSLSLMAVDPARGTVYLGGQFENSTASGSEILALKPSPWAVLSNVTSGLNNLNSISYDSHTGLAYLAFGNYYVSYVNCGGGGMYSFDANSSTLAKVGPMACAADTVFDPENGYIYVSDPILPPPFPNVYGMSAVNPATGAMAANITGLAGEQGSPLYTIAAANPANGDVYASSPGSYAISVVGGSSNTVVSEILLGATPDSLAFASDGLVFVADRQTNTLWFLNATTGQVEGNVPVSAVSIGGMVYDPTNGYLYVVSGQSSVAPAHCATLSGGGGYACYSQKFDNVTVFDTMTETVVATIPVNTTTGGPFEGVNLVSAAFDPVSNKVFVTGSSGNGGFVFVIDASTNTLSGNISLGAQPSATGAIAYDPVTGYVYALGGTECGSVIYSCYVEGSDRLYAINGSTGAIVANSSVPLSDAMAVDSKTGTIYTVGDGLPFELATINATTGNVIAITSLPCSSGGEVCGTMAAAYDPSNDEVYVAVTMGGSPILASYDTATGAAGAVYDGATIYRINNGWYFPGQQAVVYDPLANELFTSAGYSSIYSSIGAISIISPLNATFVPVSSSSLQVSAVLPDGSPVSGVSVSVPGLEFVTGGTGTLAFTGLPSGSAEPVQACVDGLCVTKTVTLAPGSNAVSFEIQSAHALVTGAQGTAVAGVQLTFSGTGGVAGLLTTNSSGLTPSVLSPSGATLTITTNLYGTGLPYETPAAESFTVNGTTPIIELQPLPTGTLQGLVSYSNGTVVADARVTIDEQINGVTLTDSALTNATGGYSAAFYSGQATAYAASPQLLSSSLEDTTIAPGLTTVLDLNIPLVGPSSVAVDVFVKYLNQTQFLPFVYGYTTAHAGKDPTLTDANGQEYDVSSNPFEFAGYAGEVVKACWNGYSFGLPLVCDSAQLNPSRNATISLYAAQQGLVRATIVSGSPEEPVSSWSANVYSVNATGFALYVTSISNLSASLSYSPPGPGEFEFQLSSRNSQVQTLFGSVEVSISQAQITNLGNVELSAGVYFTGKQGNGVASLPSVSAPGGVVEIRGTYNSTATTTLANVTLQLQVPAQTSLVPGSIALNLLQAKGVIQNGSYYYVPVGELSAGESGIVSYELLLSQSLNATQLSSSVYISYSVQNQVQRELIGTADVQTNAVTIFAPSSIASLNVSVSGQAPQASTVTVYDNQTVLGSVLVPAGGYWEGVFSLPDVGNSSANELHAEASTNGGTVLYSKTIEVGYVDGQVELTKMCMDQSDGRLVCWNPSTQVAQFPYVIEIYEPISFSLYFNEPNDVTGVAVHLGHSVSGNASLGSNGVYSVSFNVPSGSWWESGWDGTISVTYLQLPYPKYNGTLPTPTLPEKLPPDQSVSGIPVFNITLTSESSTSFSETISLPNGTFLMTSTGSLTANYSMDLTQAQIVQALSSGLPVYNFSVSVTALNSTVNLLQISYFVPNDAQVVGAASDLAASGGVVDPIGTLFKLMWSYNGGILSKAYDFCVTYPAVCRAGSGGEATTIKVASALDKAELVYKSESALSTFVSLYDAGKNLYTLENMNQELNNLAQCALLNLQPGEGQKAYLNLIFADEHLVDVAEGAKYLYNMATAPFDFLVSAVTGKVVAVGNDYLNSIVNQVQNDISTLGGDINCGTHPVSNVNQEYDPSGVVYAGLLTNPVANATVIVLQYNSTTSQWVPWAASGFGQLNPQETDQGGRYAWFVPAGRYMVVVQAPGYSTASSIVVYVPPPATGVDIDLSPSSPPSVSGVSVFSNSTGSFIELSFDQLMRASTLNGTTIAISSNGGQNVTGTIFPVSSQLSPGGVPLTSEAIFVPSSPLLQGVNYTVLVSPSVENYANMTMGSAFRAEAGIAPLTYTLTTDATDVAPGEPLNATATTNDPLSKDVQFTWLSPAGQPVSSSLTALSSSGASSTFTPSQNGTWVVEATFTDGMNVIKTLTRTLYVVQPSPLTELFVTAVANGTGAASADSALSNGINVVLTGIAPGASVGVDTFDYVATPPGTTSLSAQTGTTAIGYFDVGVVGASAGSATVCFTLSGVSSSDLLYYYSVGEGAWVEASGPTFASPDTLCGSVGVSELGGTPFAAAQPPSTPPSPVAFAFSLSVSPSSESVTQGGTATATVTVSLISGSTQPVSLSASGLPSEAPGTFSLTSCTPSCTSTLSIPTSSTTPAGTYSITVTASGGSSTETAAFTLTVTPSTTTTTTTTSTTTTTTTSSATTTSFTTAASSTTTTTTSSTATTPEPPPLTTTTTASTTSVYAASPQATAMEYAEIALAVVLLAVVAGVLMVSRKRAWWH